MTIIVTKVNNFKIPIFLFMAVVGCSKQRPFETAYEVPSPDGQNIAKLEVLKGGTLVDDDYRLFIVSKITSKQTLVFKGSDGWTTDPPTWIGSTQLILPFCLGRIDTVSSTNPNNSEETFEFRGSAFSALHVHIITSPETIVAGRKFCSN